MKVLILTPEYLGGSGIATFYQSVAPALRDRGCELRVIEGSAYSARENRERRSVGGIVWECLEVGRIQAWSDRFRAFAATPGLRRHLAAAWAMWEQAEFGADADAIEACDWGLLFAPAAVEAACPLVVQCHGSLGQISTHDPMAGEEIQGSLVRLLERALLQKTQVVQTYSNANAAFWRAETDRDVGVIRPAWRPFTPSPLAPAGDRGLVVGRLQRWKGPDVLCAALEILGPRAPVIDWFGGDMPWDSKDEKASAYLAANFPAIWGSRVIHRPPIAREEVARRQASAFLNIVPSNWDVFNFTAIEAMASGRPTIVSAGAGAGELIEDGTNGFLFVAGDADSLAGAIDRVMTEKPVRLIEIGRAALITIREKLDPVAIAEQRIVAYRDAISHFHASPPATIAGWLGGICRASSVTSNGSELAFLQHLPLRKLTRRVAELITRRILHRS